MKRRNNAADTKELLMERAETSSSPEELGRLYVFAEQNKLVELSNAVRNRVADEGLTENDFRLNPSKFDRCVKAVKKSGSGRNAYAICTAAGTRSNPLPAISTFIPLDLWDINQLDQAGKRIFTSLHTTGRRHSRNPRNPLAEATEMYESFHGKPSEKVTAVEEQIHEHEALAELGLLEELRVKSEFVGMVYLKNFDGAFLCANEAGTQLFIRGGDQEVDLQAFEIEVPHEKERLGEIKQIRYFTEKKHLGKEGGVATYYHDFGEEDAAEGERPRRPILVYSVRDKLLSIVGGAYTITPEGIAN